MPVSEFLSNLADTAKGIAKIALQSRPVSLRRINDNNDRELIILANGPSLRQTIDRYGDKLARRTCMAVNFAANTPEFTIIRPKYYILADPHFFKATSDPNVAKLIASIEAVTWPMKLFIDRRYKHNFSKVMNLPECVGIETFNATGVEGFGWFEHLAYSSRLAMPRPRNVLIPSIMIGIALGYKTILLCGADHSWMRDLRVNDDNEVISGMSHYYKESEKEINRSKNEYRNYRLHQILFSYYTAFKSYHKIRRYADSKNVDIINATPGSYIDAFRRSSQY